MINFYQKEKLRGVVEEVWLNEGRSEYTSTLCGYDNLYEGSNLEKRVADFLRNPADSLTEWENQPADYGVVNLFMQYFVGRYGEQILTKMMKSETSSIESINRALSELGFFERFSDVFANWLIASFINDCQLGEGQKYCYLNRFLTYERLHVNPIISNILSVKEGAKFSFSDSVEDWTGRWYDISPLGSGFNLLLKFKGGAGSNFYVPVIIFNKDGRKTIRYLKFDNLYNASDIILNFGNQVDKVVLIPFNRTKTAGFLVNETLFPFSFSAEITSASQIPSVSESPSVISPTPSPAPPTTPSAVKPNYNDGSLIRAKDDFKVFIVKGKYKRWIQSPQILAAYPHLGWQNVIEITSGEHDWYQSAWLIRAEGDYKVYEINSDGTKHWLNMSAEWFVNSGRSWDMVYVVNSRERDLYKTGENVLR
jgi:hypothetical protein